MIDLHVHTYYSDGTNSPEAVVRLAREIGVDTIAITDHDGIGGIPEAMAAGRKYGVTVIPGIEISVTNIGGNMHILGYGMNLEHEGFKAAVDTMLLNRADRNERLMTAFREMGIEISNADIKKYALMDYVGKPQMALVLKERGLIKDVKEAFASEKFFKSETMRKIKRMKFNPAEGIGIILAAGGIPVLAHPYTLKLSIEDLDQKIKELVGYGLKGLECYYSDHSPEMIQDYLGLADRYNLIKTLGSDFHGKEIDPEIMIGLGRNENLKSIGLGRNENLKSLNNF